MKNVKHKYSKSLVHCVNILELESKKKYLVHQESDMQFLHFAGHSIRKKKFQKMLILAFEAKANT